MNQNIDVPRITHLQTCTLCISLTKPYKKEHLHMEIREASLMQVHWWNQRNSSWVYCCRLDTYCTVTVPWFALTWIFQLAELHINADTTTIALSAPASKISTACLLAYVCQECRDVKHLPEATLMDGISFCIYSLT